MKFTRTSLGSALIGAIVVVSLLFGVTTAFSGQMDGARVFRDNCTKCHNERSPMEKTDKEWHVVVTHMRTIALLTAKESRAVLKYLQSNNRD